LLVLLLFVDCILLYKVICFSMGVSCFLWIHKIEEDWCRKWIGVILGFIYDSLVCVVAGLFFFFLPVQKGKEPKSYYVCIRVLSIRSRSSGQVVPPLPLGAPRPMSFDRKDRHNN